VTSEPVEIQLFPKDYAISNSEVMCYAKCRRKHYYEFLERLTPVTQGEALFRGIAGHELLDIYYRNIKNGVSLDMAERAALMALDTDIALAVSRDDFDSVNIMVGLKDTIISYFGYAQNDDWEILAVEESFIQEFDGMLIGMRLDLLIMPRSGQFRGQKILVDHKFSYAKWSENDVLLNGQPYKYGAIMRSQGHDVKHVMYNTILYRSKTEICDRKMLTMTHKQQDTAIHDHLVYAKEIQAAKAGHEIDPDRYRDEKAARCLDRYTCKMCSFKDICLAEMSGITPATELSRRVNYMPNDYGYVIPVGG